MIFTFRLSGKLYVIIVGLNTLSDIPWKEIEEKFSALFIDDLGVPAKPIRMALGALSINKEKCDYSDRGTVKQIMENLYLQYFIGLKEFPDDAPFDPSLMVHLCKRLGLEIIQEI